MPETNPTPQPSRTAWIPESPAHPGLYAVKNGPLASGQNCTMNVYEAREFTTFDACSDWCAENQVPPFTPMEHLFAQAPPVPRATPEDGVMAELKPGDRVRIKDNIGAVLQELGFDPGIPEEFQRRYAGTEQTAHSVWMEKDSKEQYATIDLCCEIPIRCCELIPK